MKAPLLPNKITVFSGAGISVASGLPTFRDTGGLWEGPQKHLATMEAWDTIPEQVLAFYNTRKAEMLQAQPNAAHLAIARLESKYDVTVITQNVDDLHERAGSPVLFIYMVISRRHAALPTRPDPTRPDPTRPDPTQPLPYPAPRNCT
jgi:NAD-dependent deacetylase